MDSIRGLEIAGGNWIKITSKSQQSHIMRISNAKKKRGKEGQQFFSFEIFVQTKAKLVEVMIASL